MPDSNTVKSKRDMAMDRLRTKYPDKSFEDEESLWGQINDDYDDYDKRLAESQSRESAFSNMFTSNPKSARLMMEWKDGKDPVASLIRIYGKEDILAAIEDPEKLEAIEQANKEFAEKVAKNDEYEAQYEQNLPASIQAIETWASGKGISEEDIDNAVTALSKLCGDFILGKIAPESIEMMLKAMNYDTAVEEAAAEGEVAGRNAKIEEKLRKSKKGDGTAPLDGKSVTNRPNKVKDLGALNRYDDGNKNIFERGGERRIARK